MPRIRAELKKSKWKLPKHQFYTAYHFALQYQEWKDEYDSLITLKAVNLDGMPHGTTPGNPTETAGMRMAELTRKMKMIEDTVREASSELYDYLIKSVTREGTTYEYLSLVGNMPCGRRQYYESRQRFYWLLSKKLF